MGRVAIKRPFTVALSLSHSAVVGQFRSPGMGLQRVEPELMVEPTAGEPSNQVHVTTAAINADLLLLLWNIVGCGEPFRETMSQQRKHKFMHISTASRPSLRVVRFRQTYKVFLISKTLLNTRS